MIYNIWFQDSEILMVVEAKNNKEARRIFNKQISIKKDPRENQNKKPRATQ